MASLGKQLWLLTWKNLILHKRSWIATLLEVCLPVFFAVVLVLIRLAAQIETIDDSTHFSSLSLLPIPTKSDRHNDTLLFSPNVTDVTNVVNAAAARLNILNVKGYATESDVVDAYALLNKSSIVAALIFDGSKNYTAGIPKRVGLSIRCPQFSKDVLWRTDRTFPFVMSNGPRSDTDKDGDPQYYETGFLSVQYAISRELIEYFNGTAVQGWSVDMLKIPYAPYYKDTLMSGLQTYMPFFFILSFIVSVLMTSKNIVYEKERKLKESMKMMGLNNFIYWFSWFLKIFIFMIFAMALFAILFSIDVGHGALLNKSDPSVIFVFLMLYGMANISFCFLICSIFSKANTAALGGGVIFYLTYSPWSYVVQQYETMDLSPKLGLCVLHNIAMAMGINSLTLYEMTGFGAQWDNIHQPGTLDDNFSLMHAMLMLLGDTAIYFLLAWYLDAVHPGEFGVPLPLYFPFTKSYWCGGDSADGHFSSIQSNADDPNRFEREPQNMTLGMSLQHLRKVFGGSKKKVAVDNMNLNLYEGQLTVLLGHNGAGKTTTMSMISGFLPPTSGTAVVYGKDIRTDLPSVRKGLGLCPQHNILFDTLTVEEHLKFFAQLKGCPSGSLDKEIDEMLRVISLEEKRSALSKTLSGGQKRKLSVGIALIAGSKVIILDEPTSGMDPSARRHCWEILQKYKAGRTMLLTTHFMDEADILGDRIAIMAEGVVECCGTSHFLKKAYGAGYHLVVVKNADCNVDRLTQLIQSHVTSSYLESQISAEISYVLPFDQSSKFEKLFGEIEQRSAELGISSFGTSATTMEEVFLKVGESVDHEADNNKVNGVESNGKINGIENKGYGSMSEKLDIMETEIHESNAHSYKVKNNLPLKHVNCQKYIAFNENLKKNRGMSLIMQQFFGMFVKKFLHTLRNVKVTVSQLILPIVFTIIALVVEVVIPSFGTEPALPLNLAPFDGADVSFSSGLISTAASMSMSDFYKNQFRAPDKTHLIDRGNYPRMQYYWLNKSEDVTAPVFRRRYVIGTDFEDDGTNISVTSYFHDQPFHSPGISLAFTMNTMLQYFAGDDHSLEITNFPLPRDTTDKAQSSMITSLALGFNISFTILFGMSFLITSFIIFLIKERNIGAKHLQSVSGVGTIAYWLSNFCWDYINYMIPVLGLLIVFAAFGTEAYNKDTNMGIVFLIFVFYGWAVLPFVYLFHYLFKTPATGMVVVTLINIVTGLLTLMAVFILQLPVIDAGDIPDILDWIFSVILPNYCVGQSLTNMYINYEYGKFCQMIIEESPIPFDNLCLIFANPCCKDNCGDFCMKYLDDYLDWETPGVGRYLFFMFLQGCVFSIIAFIVELGLFKKLSYLLCKGGSPSVGSSGMIEQGHGDPDEDSDVKDEQNRINNTSLTKLQETDSLILKNLSKHYGSLQAVKNINVGIPPQECFGLLGQNGAGKTTTFKMLTGDVMISSGNAYLYTFDVKQDLKKVQQNMGYCPQFDALIDQLTGRETLTLYARLRGVSEKQIKLIVEQLLNVLMLNQYADRQTGTYSGGNKRKLSTAIALIGDPPFILLDEPTTGMDPGARRQLWNVLSEVRSSGRTLILTSHSMEECDALCTRIVIMVNGKFVCYGSPQHLKNKFGHGYTLLIQTGLSKRAEETQQDLLQFINSQFPVDNVFDDKQGYLYIQIPDSSISIGKIFGVMEQAKMNFTLEDYAVHQTTLEQVFLKFTRQQVPPKEKKKGLCSVLCKCLSSSNPD